ncbi:MAG: hypothetical protein ACTSRS_16040 [Candidatus Helarchaeota archaeon]
MQSIWDMIVQWLIDNIHVIVLSLPGIAGLLWKILEWRKSRKLEAEIFKPRLDISFSGSCYKKAGIEYVAGNVIIENIGDLTTEVTSLIIEMTVEGLLEINHVSFFRDPQFEEGATEITGEWAKIEYNPPEEGKWFVIEPKRKFILPIRIQYHARGNGDFIIHPIVTARLTKRLDEKAIKQYQDSIYQVEQFEQIIGKQKQISQIIYDLYDEIYTKYKEYTNWYPRPLHEEDILTHQLEVIEFLKRYQHRLRSVSTSYNIPDFLQFSQMINLSKIWRFSRESVREDIINYVSQLSDEVHEIIRNILTDEAKIHSILLTQLDESFIPFLKKETEIFKKTIKNKEMLNCLLDIRAAIVQGNRLRFQELVQKFKKYDVFDKAFQTRIDGLLQSIEHLEHLKSNDRKTLLFESLKWEFWNENKEINKSYINTYRACFSKRGEKALYEFDEVFYIHTPEALVEAKTVTDLEFNYQIIQLNSDIYLQGKLLILNKRNVKTRFQGLKLILEPVPDAPSIKFYNSQTQQFESTLNVLPILNQEWLEILPKKLTKFNVQQVRAITNPYQVENIDFITKIEGSGFFKLHAEIVSAPIISPEEDFHHERFSSKNVEEFIGFVGLMEGMSPITPISTAQTQISVTPSIPPRSSSKLDEAREALKKSPSSLSSSVTPHPIELECPLCNSKFLLDSEVGAKCPYCGYEFHQ